MATPAARSPSPIPPVAVNRPITIQIDFPRGTPTPKMNFRSAKASIYENNAAGDHGEKPTTPSLHGYSPNATGSHWYLKHNEGGGASVTGGGFNATGTQEGAKLPKNVIEFKRPKKNFVDINKDVRIIMNQKKIERVRRQLTKDKQAWSPTVV